MTKNIKLIINNSFSEKKQKSFFEKNELKIILDFYAQMVSQGSWKDYGLNISSKHIGFSVFKNSSEGAMYKICKDFKPIKKNLKYFIIDSTGKIIKNSYNLTNLITNTDWKNLKN